MGNSGRYTPGDPPFEERWIDFPDEIAIEEFFRTFRGVPPCPGEVSTLLFFINDASWKRLKV